MKKIISLLLALVLTLSACSVALAADVVLRPGDKGDAVKEVQTLLTSYGYYSGKINGSYNTATTTAVRNFQRYNSLTVDGKVGPKTMAVLKSGNAVSAPLKPNETNNSASVKMVQTLLRDLGYYNGKIDGKYGKATIAAVKMFQKYNELPIDGKVGEDTLNRMKSSAAIKAPVNQKDSYSTENKHIQERLKYYGYYTGRVDGIYGSGSIAAVKAFQRANGLKVDGAVGPLTLAKLDSNNAVSKKDADQATDVGTRPILRPGDKEAAKVKYIKEVQTILKAKGLYTGEIDGVYSGIIVTAVRLFQLAREHAADVLSEHEDVLVGVHHGGDLVHRRRLQRNRFAEMADQKNLAERGAALRAMQHRQTVAQPEKGQRGANRLAGLERADGQWFGAADDFSHGVFLVEGHRPTARHSGEGRNPGFRSTDWIPAFAGMTE